MNYIFTSKGLIVIFCLFIFSLVSEPSQAQPIQDLRFVPSSVAGPNGTLTVTVQAKVDVAANWGSSTYIFTISNIADVLQINSWSIASAYSAYSMGTPAKDGSGNVTVVISEPVSGVALSVGTFADLFTIEFENDGTGANNTSITWGTQTLTAFGGGGMVAGSFTNSGSVPLPVRLLSFNASVGNNLNELNWTTAIEINNERFDVERSRDGITFSTIGSVPGVGNCNTLFTYQYKDINPPSEGYYRLKQVDYNADFEYSRVIKVFNNSVPVRVPFFPNPAGKEITVASDLVSFRIYNVAGKMLIDQTGSFSIEHLLPGIYIVETKDNNGIIRTERLSKSKNN